MVSFVFAILFCAFAYCSHADAICCPVLADSVTASNSTRVDFSSQPEGVKVMVGGKVKGVTPLSLFDLKPGKHHIRFECENHERADEFLTLSQGEYLSKHIELQPVKGLLLLTTDPAGASVTLNGISLGETPRLITTLDAKDTHCLKLEKPGYQPKNVDVKFDGRTPLAKHEKLVLNSGILEISTIPEGANVLVNGINRGVTPMKVGDIPKGNAKIELKLKGYKDVSRVVNLDAGDLQKIDVTLEGVPGTLKLMSLPEGARFYLNNSAQGKSPVVLRDLPPGEYVVRAEMEGCESVSRTIKINNGESVVEEFRLASVLGRLEIRTQPVGVNVYVDGKLRGVTRATTNGSEVSDVFTVNQLPAGEHTITLKCHGYAEVVKRSAIEAKKTSVLEVKMKKVFTPNVKIVTLTGTYSGVLIKNGADELTLEVSPGVVRTFSKLDLRKVDFLTEKK